MLNDSERNLTEDLIDNYFVSLWDDAKEASVPFNQRPLLAHYTSINNFENILKNNEIWFSHPRTMNDINEQRFGIHKFQTLLYNNIDFLNSIESQSMKKIFIEGFSLYCNALDHGHFDNFYCFCLSEHQPDDYDGRLSMWRGYGANGGGIAIVIDPTKVKENDPSIFFAPVNYPKESEQEKWSEEIIKRFSNIVKMNKFGKTHEEITKLINILFNRIRIASLYSKHKGFEEESEWRLSIHFEDSHEKDNRICRSYVLNQNGIQPKLKYRFLAENQKIEDLIEMIIVGPTNASVMTKTALELMLRNINQESLIPKIKLSSIPFHPSKN